MTPNEINRRLALAIGYAPKNVRVCEDGPVFVCRHNSDGTKSDHAKDWAHAAARGVIADLTDRRSIKWALEDEAIDYETRSEIVSSLAEIIRVAAEIGRRMKV